jgi:uncharacterized protein (UPF0332 family)
MDGREFLRLANILRTGASEAEWRSAVSRAYYAAFHCARRLLLNCGFNVPRSEYAHAYLWLRLANCGTPAIQQAGADFNNLRRDRNRADYDLDRPLRKATAEAQVQAADDIIRALADAEKEPVKTAISDAMKSYEHDVLKEVTWHK